MFNCVPSLWVYITGIIDAHTAPLWNGQTKTGRGMLRDTQEKSVLPSPFTYWLDMWNFKLTNVNIRVLKAKHCTLSSLHFQMEKNLLLTLGLGWNLISKSLDSALSFSLVQLVVSEKKVWSPGILTHFQLWLSHDIISFFFFSFLGVCYFILFIGAPLSNDIFLLNWMHAY